MQNIEFVVPKSILGTPPTSSMLLVGTGTAGIAELRRAAFESALAFVQKPTIPAAAAWLEQERPGAVLIDLRTLSARDLFSSLRKTPKWAHVPMIGLSSSPSELAFAETFWAGGDDVVNPAHIDQLVARLRATQRAERQRSSISRGRVVVAGSDPVFRVAAGRVLQGAGYDVDFALTAEELVKAAEDEHVELVVASVELPGGSALAVLEAVRAAGRNVPFVISVTPRFFARARLLSRKVKGIALCDSFAPPDDLLFAANDLLLCPNKNLRSTPRIPYGTMVWIRPAGSQSDIVAYTYNVSAKGLFARTLYPFAAGQAAWIEITPPRSERRVRLSAQAVWHRPFGPLGPALSPPGTGFQITGGLPGEVELYEAGCASLSESFGGE